MQNEFNQIADRERMHRALPKSKTLSNKVWENKGGNGSYAAPAVLTFTCQANNATATPASATNTAH